MISVEQQRGHGTRSTGPASRVQEPLEAPGAPPSPRTLEETGITGEAIDELLLKTLYAQGARTGREVTEAIALPFSIIDDRLAQLQQRRLLEVTGTTGPNRGSFRFNLTGDGRDRAREAMEVSQYVGPAPVPLAVYEEWIVRQSLRRVRVTPDRMAEEFEELVLDPDVFGILGPAINSARSIFLHGAPGNGKTHSAEIIARLLGGSVYIPHAVDITGQIMILFDLSHHVPVAEVEDNGSGPDWFQREPAFDQRFVHVRRPVVTAGGELTLQQLDLEYDYKTRVYQAPFQLKAAGGVLIIDDFGRQHVAADDLLNRWIVPLEKRVDYLTLHTGVKFRVPFDALLIFATNLQPEDLVDEAFLRRIQYKIEMTSPDRAALGEIMRRECDRRGIPFLDSALDLLYDRYYTHGVEPRGCHPRDVLDHLEDIAHYEGVEARPEGEILERACATYFLVMAPEAVQTRGRMGRSKS